MLTFLTPALQNLLALALVGGAAVWLVVRSVRRKKAGACGCSSCPSNTPSQNKREDFIPLEEVLSSRD